MSAKSAVLSYATLGVAHGDCDLDWPHLRSHECLYCGTIMLHDQPDASVFALGITPSMECPSCGWWFVNTANGGPLESESEVTKQLRYMGLVGVLESFDLASAALPISILANELPKHLDKIGVVNPNRMQDYVSSILKGVYDCEAQQMGYSHDGGIDLILLRSESPVAVQIKRRVHSSKAESVEGIRAFLGAALLSGIRDLLFVTTAERYSRSAEQAASSAVRAGIVRSFNLIDRSVLTDFMRTDHASNNMTIAFAQFLSSAHHGSEPDAFARVVGSDPFGWSAEFLTGRDIDEIHT